MVSPSRMETTGPVKSAMARKGLNRNRREQGHIFFPATRMEARQKDAFPMRLSRQWMDDASLHRFCG